MKAERLDEHDMTKKMVDIMRGGYKSLLTEVDDNQNMDFKQPQTKMVDTVDGPEPDGTLTPVQGDAVFNDELKELRSTVDSNVQITNFKIYPNDNNIMIEGVFEKRQSENSGIKFRMELNVGEIKTSMVDVDLTDEISELLKKLQGYYINWRNKWGERLPTEYPPKNNN